jgi:formate/nitrite transporter FocA (FNT family)
MERRRQGRTDQITGQYGFANGALGKTALVVASMKAALPTIQLFFLALLCNVLVCLAVWMSFGAQSSTDKVAVIVPPIAAFVAAGFEHSIASFGFHFTLRHWHLPHCQFTGVPQIARAASTTSLSFDH